MNNSVVTNYASDHQNPESKPKRIFVVSGLPCRLVATVVLSLERCLNALNRNLSMGSTYERSQFASATVYRAVYATAEVTGCATAQFQPMQHALALGVIGTILALVGTIATWNAGPEFGRKWYPIALVLISVPCGWIGGKLQARKSTK